MTDVAIFIVQILLGLILLWWFLTVERRLAKLRRNVDALALAIAPDHVRAEVLRRESR